MDVERQVRGPVHRLDHRRAKGDVVHEVAVHDVQMHPVRTIADGASDFGADSGEIRGQQGGGDNAFLKRMLHAMNMDEKRRNGDVFFPDGKNPERALRVCGALPRAAKRTRQGRETLRPLPVRFRRARPVPAPCYPLRRPRGRPMR